MNINYYNNNYIKYIETTKDCDMSELYHMFEKHLNKGVKIIDLGFGSGRDSLYFLSKGYKVTSVDPSTKFCEKGKEIGLPEIVMIDAQHLSFANDYDAIWACASLLHINSKELPLAFNNCYKALINKGIMYCSFKYGDKELIEKERFFNYMTEEKFNSIINKTKFKISEILITTDVRENRENEHWFNVILKKEEEKYE